MDDLREGTGPFGLCTIKECADQLKVGVANLREWLREGVVSTQMVGGKRWWNVRQVDDDLRAHLGLSVEPSALAKDIVGQLWTCDAMVGVPLNVEAARQIATIVEAVLRATPPVLVQVDAAPGPTGKAAEA